MKMKKPLVILETVSELETPSIPDILTCLNSVKKDLPDVWSSIQEVIYDVKNIRNFEQIIQDLVAIFGDAKDLYKNCSAIFKQTVEETRKVMLEAVSELKTPSIPEILACVNTVTKDAPVAWSTIKQIYDDVKNGKNWEEVMTDIGVLVGEGKELWDKCQAIFSEHKGINGEGMLEFASRFKAPTPAEILACVESIHKDGAALYAQIQHTVEDVKAGNYSALVNDVTALYQDAMPIVEKCAPLFQ